MWIQVSRTECINLNMAERLFLTMHSVDKLSIVAGFSGDKTHTIETFSIADEPRAIARLMELCKLCKKK
jgi:hypothetical protein